jgi:hypothetical protein
MECRYLSEDEFETWDDLVDLADGGTVFHKSFWFHASGKPFSVVGCFHNGALAGGLPIVKKKRFGLTKAGLPLLTPYVDILSITGASNKIKRNSFKRKVVESVLEFIQNRHHMVSMGLSPDFTDLTPFLNRNFRFRIKVTYRINLKNDVSALWSSLHGSRRKNIKKAEKTGFKVNILDNFRILSDLITKTYERQGKDQKIVEIAEPYVREAIENRRGACFITMDEGGSARGGVFLAWDNHCAYYLLGGFDHEKGGNNATTLALWKGILHAKEVLNLNVFDFEGSIVPRLETFFRRFGGDLKHYFRVEWETKLLRFINDIRRVI